jgi:kynurenine formamidase
MTIDEVPMDWYCGPGVLIDMTHTRPEEPIEPDDVQQALDNIQYGAKENDLIDRGVRVMGVDAYNFDMPFATQKRLYEETGDASAIEPCHIALDFERNYAHIEKLADLDKVPPPYGFTFSALPIKIRGASGGVGVAPSRSRDDG